MKFEEILPALREGKKVRRKMWDTDMYKAVSHKIGNYFTPSDILAQDWELHDDRQYMNFLEAVKVTIKTGKMPRPKVYVTGNAPCLQLNFGNQYVVFNEKELLGDWYVE